MGFAGHADERNLARCVDLIANALVGAPLLSITSVGPVTFAVTNHAGSVAIAAVDGGVCAEADAAKKVTRTKLTRRALLMFDFTSFSRQILLDNSARASSKLCLAMRSAFSAE